LCSIGRRVGQASEQGCAVAQWNRGRLAELFSKAGGRSGKLPPAIMSELLWYIPLGLLALLLFLLLRNRAYKVCPWFVVYVAFAVAADVARFVVRNNQNVYPSTYWITEAGYCLLGILVMY